MKHVSACAISILLLSLPADSASNDKAIATLIANVDVAIVTCGDRLVLNGQNFISVQSVWRAKLATKDGSKLNKLHLSEVQKMMKESEVRTDNMNERCWAAYDWFRKTMGKDSPFSNVRNDNGELIGK